MKYFVFTPILSFLIFSYFGCKEDTTEPSTSPDYNILLNVHLPIIVPIEDSTLIEIQCGIQTSGIIEWKRNVNVSLLASSGTLKLSSGQTDSLGKFSTFLNVDNSNVDSISVSVTATYDNHQKDTTVFTYTATKGLKTLYSSGQNKIEGPIFNGYWNDCSNTGNNLYQGECTEVDSSPVNWAWGNFNASWEGYIYIPSSGQYTFNSHYWVDGIIHIEINDTIITDINTPGGGFNKTISIPERNWYPVYMTFASNGGSNNMHLGWTKPGYSWEIVPIQNLAHR